MKLAMTLKSVQIILQPVPLDNTRSDVFVNNMQQHTGLYLTCVSVILPAADLREINCA